MAKHEVVKLGFIGSGFMGQLAHIENYYKQPNVEKVALAEGRLKTANLVAQRYGIKKVYAHHRDMLRDADIDAVVAIAHFDLNAPLVEDTLNAGKHVLTEKPQVNTSVKGHELAKLAKDHGLVYQVGYMKRFDPGVRWAKQRIEQWIETGEFGPLQSVRIWCAHGEWNWFRPSPLDAGDEPVDYGLALEPKPAWANGKAWQLLKEWTNYYSHQTNLARYLIGQDFELQTAKRIENNHFVQCAYQPTGAHLYFDFPVFQTDSWHEGFEVVFKRAKLTASLPAPLATNQTARIVAYEHGSETGQYVRPSLPSVDGFARQSQNFIAAVREEKTPLSPASEAVKEIEFAESLVQLYQRQGDVGDE